VLIGNVQINFGVIWHFVLSFLADRTNSCAYATVLRLSVVCL